MPPGRRLRRGGQFSASIVGILNSKSNTDIEARNNILKVYLPLLCLAFVIDIGSALSMVYIQCSSDNDGGDIGSNECVWKELRNAFQKKKKNDDNHNDEISDGLGDLLWLALIRCLLTSLLLWIGVKYGKVQKKRSDPNDTGNDGYTCTIINPHHHEQVARSLRNGDGNNNRDSIQDAEMTTPLLIDESNATDATDNNHTADTLSRNGNLNSLNASLEDQAETQENYQDNPIIMSDDNTDAQNTRVNGNTMTTSTTNQNKYNKLHTSIHSLLHKVLCTCCRIDKDGEDTLMNNPRTVKNTTLVILFILSTFFQLYAGIKVSTFHYPSEHDHSSTINPALPPLMCLTILWINIISYFFRVLLEELTREDALFLPPAVHRHPVFYEESRGINLHWCDICRTRIIASSNSEDGVVGCYRCSLCDFDICMKCAKREDAAIVGENLLRGDQGVRTEQVLDNSSYLSRSWVFVRPQLCLLCVSLFMLTCSSVTKLALPHFQGRIIDTVIPDKDGSHNHQGFVRYIRIYVVVMILQGAVSTIYSAIFTLISRRLKFTLRNSLFESILSQDVAYFDGTESGRLISRLTNDLDLMMSPIQSSLSSLLNNILILIGGMVMCFVKSYRLSMLAFVTIGPITYLWNLYAQWSKGLAREMLAYWAEGNSIASQALSHVRTVKAFGCESRVVEKYSEANKEALDRGIKDAWGNGFTSALTGYLDLGAGVLILYFGGLLVFEGVMSVGDLVTFQLFWNMMNNAYQNLQGLITSFTRSAAGAEKIFSLYDSKPDIDPKKGEDISWDVKGDIELRNVKFYYQMRPDNIVLDNFSLCIPAGKTIALVGKSGGGKSTIINLLLRFYDVKDGSMLLDGRNYKSLKVPQLRSLFGVVTQETELFSMTVEENIAYGLKKDEYTEDDLMNAAKKAQAYEFIANLKDGFQTRIGERGNRLSGGQRQRIAIARVFLRKPKIILLDEATSALDENSQEAVQKALNTLIAESGATVVVVAHRLSTVSCADSIVVIEQGVALEQGTHDELVNAGGIYASMVQKQNKKRTNELKQEQDNERDI